LTTVGLLVAGACAAEVVNMSGTWALNVEKSKWGQVPKPVSVVVTVDHKEPAISYTGRIVQVDGEESREFTFQGAIDGKAYPLQRNLGDGKVILKRVDDTTITSEFTSNDGAFKENVRSTITRDGKVLRRMMERRGTSGEMAWMEVYEKRQ
jgi:hypothetical protein